MSSFEIRHYVAWWTDRLQEKTHTPKMETASDRRILAAERLSGGVVITFDNGECAIYSPTLLYSMFPKAFRVDESKQLIEQD
jgi:hypothetical protein